MNIELKHLGYATGGREKELAQALGIASDTSP